MITPAQRYPESRSSSLSCQRLSPLCLRLSTFAKHKFDALLPPQTLLRFVVVKGAQGAVVVTGGYLALENLARPIGDEILKAGHVEHRHNDKDTHIVEVILGGVILIVATAIVTIACIVTKDNAETRLREWKRKNPLIGTSIDSSIPVSKIDRCLTRVAPKDSLRYHLLIESSRVIAVATLAIATLSAAGHYCICDEAHTEFHREKPILGLGEDLLTGGLFAVPVTQVAVIIYRGLSCALNHYESWQQEQAPLAASSSATQAAVTRRDE